MPDSVHRVLLQKKDTSSKRGRTLLLTSPSSPSSDMCESIMKPPFQVCCSLPLFFSLARYISTLLYAPVAVLLDRRDCFRPKGERTPTPKAFSAGCAVPVARNRQNNRAVYLTLGSCTREQFGTRACHDRERSEGAGRPQSRRLKNPRSVQPTGTIGRTPSHSPPPPSHRQGPSTLISAPF